MKKRFCLIIFFAAVSLVYAVENDLQIVKRAANGKGMLCKLQDKKMILLVEGTPAEMGTAHGQLLAAEIKSMSEKTLLIATGYLIDKDDWFFTRIQEVMQRTRPYTPDRFLQECDAMSQAAGISAADGRHMNFFPEMFHCSGVAVRNSATVDGKIIHARVLDYMRDIRFQNYAALMVFMPEGHNSWVSLSFAGFIGTVTAMNDKGLAMGEMGGGGQGKWDGLPMNFMMRRVMEECSTVDEAIKLMKSVPLTCDYYYVISDKHKNMVGVCAISGSPLKILQPGEQDEMLPPVPADTVYLSAKDRAKCLSERLRENFGKIDVKKMIEMIKRPVAMQSNLHNAIFLPESGTIYFADAGAATPACDEPYYCANLTQLINFYSANRQPKNK